MTISRPVTHVPGGLHRRDILKGTVGAGVAAGLAVASPAARRAMAAPNLQQGLSGTIRVAYADEAGYKPKYVQQAADAVMKANPDAKIQIDLRQVSGDDFQTQLLLELDSGKGPDVIHISGGQIGQFADTGYIAPLDNYVGQWADWAQYPASVQSGVSYNGHVWGIPYGLDMRWLYLRKDLLDKAGLGADWQPTNIASVLDAAKAVKDTGSDAFALYAGEIGSDGSNTNGFLPIVLANGGNLITADNKWVSDSPAINAAFQYYVDAWQTDKVVPTSILTTPQPWKPMRSAIGTGKLGMVIEGGWVYGSYQAGAKDGSVDLSQIGYVLIPTAEAGPTFTIGGSGTCWFIGAKSENADLAWAFIQAFNQPDIVANLNIEDPHPVARQDAAQLPQFAQQSYLVQSTEALNSAVFLPPLPQLPDVSTLIQKLTGQIATGDLDAPGAAQQYKEQLPQMKGIGAENVVSVTQTMPLSFGPSGGTATPASGTAGSGMATPLATPIG